MRPALNILTSLLVLGLCVWLLLSQQLRVDVVISSAASPHVALSGR
jgi:hypothetical protein